MVSSTDVWEWKHYLKGKNFLSIWCKWLYNIFLGMVIRRSTYRRIIINNKKCSFTREVISSYPSLLKTLKTCEVSKMTFCGGAKSKCLKASPKYWTIYPTNFEKELYEYPNYDGITENSHGPLFPKTIT